MSGAASSRPRICVLFALLEEAAPFLRRLAVVPELRSRCEVRVSGVGTVKAARETTKLLAEAGPIAGLIVCGYGGGLTEQITPGSLIVAERVLHVIGEPSGVPKVYIPNSRMRELAEGPCGDLVTFPKVLTTLEEKRAVHLWTKAQMVDMETAGAVAVAEQAGVPWLAVRVATDSVDEPLPFDFNALADAEGNVDRGRVVVAALTHPWKIPALIRLGSRSAQAAKNLTRFLETYLLQWPD
ncbi:MAG: Nucleoside phosphorylase [Chthonomonadaceae bacterium]|nr:Nucleoside phosphorylase [Chthonomonadaceae bacterium]